MKTYSAILVAALAVTSLACDAASAPRMPAGCSGGKCDDAGEPSASELHLDQGQSWAELRELWYYTSQGAQILPYDMFLSLEQPGGGELFSDPAYLDHEVGLIPYRTVAGEFDGVPLNPDGLPIGLSRDEDGFLGITCSACHTGRVQRPDGSEVIVDGGTGKFDIVRFESLLYSAMAETAEDSARFDRFAQRMQDRGADPENLRDRLESETEHLRNRVAQTRHVVPGTAAPGTLFDGDTLPPGPGRVDALSVLVNAAVTVAPLNSETFEGDVLPFTDYFDGDASVSEARKPFVDNFWQPSVPSKYPQVWEAPHFAFVQTNALSHIAVTRNLGEVLGVYGRTTTHRVPVDGKLVESSANVRNLMALEDWLKELKPPRGSDLYDVDFELAEAGRDVYVDNCLKCHHLPDEDARDADLPVIDWYPEAVEMARQQLSSRGQEAGSPPMIWNPWVDATVCGTDPAFRDAVATRTAKAGALAGTMLEFFESLFGRDFVEQSPLGLARLISEGPDAELSPVAILLFTEYGIIGAQGVSRQDVLDGRRPDVSPTPAQLVSYKARPLTGIGLTGCYLHNCSVRTLRDLLTPPSQRPQKFRIGSHELDFDDVGFADDGAYEIDTSLPGSRNTGHEYGTELSQAQKDQLLEFLKTL